MPPAHPLGTELEREAAHLLERFAARVGDAPVRVTLAAGGCAIELTLGPVARPGRKGAGAALEDDIVAVVAAAGRRLDRKGVVRALKDAGKRYGRSTVAKALGRLTTARRLWNDRTGKGLPGWDAPRPAERPSLFPDPAVWDAAHPPADAAAEPAGGGFRNVPERRGRLTRRRTAS